MRQSFLLLFGFLVTLAGSAQTVVLGGSVVDPQRNVVPHASVQLLLDGAVVSERLSDEHGLFQFRLADAEPDRKGKYTFRVVAAGFEPVGVPASFHTGRNPEVELRLTRLATQVANVTVTADINDLDIVSPDPGEKVFVRQDLLDANPGRPGAPVSIPGYPIETASSGIKAPQYFAPGVAGDHGEPIAQYIAVGGALVPNNLSANAHGNGYADPNLLIPEILESVQVDGGAFNVQQGNHAVNLAAIYGLRSRLDPFLTLTGDYRDVDLVAGVSPSAETFVAIEASYGNGFLKRLEHRQQFKLNTQRILVLGDHRLTLLGIGYYGISAIPGLTPIFGTDSNDASFHNFGDTIDPRQKDQTHVALFAADDMWRLNRAQQIQLSGYFRTYNLALSSDFGQGLIRQSEFRTVAGGTTTYRNKLSEAFTLLGGFDVEREAPRRDNLDQYGLPDPAHPLVLGPFTKVDSNNLTISSYTPYAAAAGSLSRYVRYYAGWRRDEIDISNQDLIQTANTFNKWTGVNSPKATVSFLPRPGWFAPLVSLSFGESFFTEDPRIGIGTGSGGVLMAGAGNSVARAHSYQLVASKSLARTDVKLTLGHVTSSAQLAKISPDTGLQQDQGASTLKFLSVAVRRSFAHESILATFSKADARDLDSGGPTPEAPRTIFDLLGSAQKLPLGLQARGEFEYVGRKPLGTGCAPDPGAQCVGTSVREFRAAVARPFQDGRWTVGVNLLLARGYTGQTIENLFPSVVQEVVGVRIPSYASVNVTHRFGHPSAP